MQNNDSPFRGMGQCRGLQANNDLNFWFNLHAF